LAVTALTTAAAADKVDPFAPHTRPSGATAPARPYTGLGAGSISAEDIAKFAPKPLAPAVSRHIQAMLDIRGAGSGVLTQKGDRMVYASRITGSSQVFRQDGPMSYPIQLTGGEDRTSVAGVTPDDKWIVIARDTGGEENPGLYVMDMHGGPLRLVQHLPKVQTALEYVADDSKSLYFSANDVDPASYAIYRYDLATEQRERVFDTPGLWHVLDHLGAKWLMVKELGNTHQEIYSYDLTSKKLDPLLGQNESEEYAAQFGAKPAQVLVRTDKLGEYHRVYSFEGGKLTPITPDLKHDVDAFWIDEARTRIYYSVNEDGYRRLYALDARTLKPLTLPKLPDAENVNLVGLSRNGRFVQLAADGSTLVPQTVVFDWTTGKTTTWRPPSSPEIDTTKFAKVSLESYPARDGTPIPMFVRRPSSCAGPCPVIVNFHGGPEGQASAGFSASAQMYVDAGFVFVQPNVRGSTGYGKTWLHADDGPKRLDVITDIEDCARYIRKAWAKDGKAPKIGVAGGSYGGYSTLMAMTYFAGAYDAGVEEVGMSNLMTFLMNTAPYRRILRTSEYGDPAKDKDALIKLSPISYVNKVSAPLLLIQGVNDPRVPVGEALQIYAALEERRISGGLILFADEGHGTAKRGNTVLALGHTIAFFENHLLGK
jgi:dipeptidyl aminopeptidase/acylaminoacyl peptidase